MGATGVRGMRLTDGASVVSMIVAQGGATFSPPPSAATAKARRWREYPKGTRHPGRDRDPVFRPQTAPWWRRCSSTGTS